MYGAIDVGTNSVRLLIGQVSEGKVRPEYRDLKYTRLGEKVAETGKLKAEAIDRTVRVLAEFKQRLDYFHVKNFRAIATSAARDANNQEELLENAQDKGIPVEIISGAEEACLSYHGAKSGLAGLSNPVVIDIGGGSTEIIYEDKEARMHYRSADVGAVRCTEACWPVRKIRRALADFLEPLTGLEGPALVGVGGTITTLAAVEQKLAIYNPDKVHGYQLSSASVRKIMAEFQALSVEERKKVPGLSPERADIIMAGMQILTAILSYLQLNHLVVSESDLLEGMILNLALEGKGKKR